TLLTPPGTQLPGPCCWRPQLRTTRPVTDRVTDRTCARLLRRVRGRRRPVAADIAAGPGEGKIPSTGVDARLCSRVPWLTHWGCWLARRGDWTAWRRGERLRGVLTDDVLWRS